MDVVIAALGSTPSSPNWDVDADVDGDGRISVRDRVMILRALGTELGSSEAGGLAFNRFDTDDDGQVSAMDALRVINDLARTRFNRSAEAEAIMGVTQDANPFDVNRDGKVTALDALNVINHLALKAQLGWFSLESESVSQADQETSSSMANYLYLDNDDDDEESEIDDTFDILARDQMGLGHYL